MKPGWILVGGGPGAPTSGIWGLHSYDVQQLDWGSGNNVLLARWTFARMGTPLQLHGHQNERLEVVLQDDFSGLIAHVFVAQGFEEF